jgi:hypothetical protein
VIQLNKSRPAQSKLFRSTRQDDGASVYLEILDDECSVLGMITILQTVMASIVTSQRGWRTHRSKDARMLLILSAI